MTLLSFLLFGVFTGIIAHRIDPHARGGIIGALVLGILGAMEGGFIVRSLLQLGVNDIHPLVFASQLFGAVIILGTQRMFSKLPQHA